MSLAEPGPALRARNAVLIAERCGWPDGSLDACEKLRGAYPAWGIAWAAGGQQRWREAGWYAWPRDHHHFRAGTVVYRKDPAGIREVLELAPQPELGWAPPGGWLPV